MHNSATARKSRSDNAGFSAGSLVITSVISETMRSFELLATAALIFAQPLGLEVQRLVTTSGDMRDMRVSRIDRRQNGRVVAHFVATAG